MAHSDDPEKSTDLPGTLTASTLREYQTTAYYASRQSQNDIPTAISEESTTMVMRNLLRTGLPLGAVGVSLITLASVAYAYGGQSQQLAANIESIKENKRAVEKITEALERLVDQQHTQHIELIKAINCAAKTP